MKNKLFVLALLIPMVLSGCGSSEDSFSSGTSAEQTTSTASGDTSATSSAKSSSSSKSSSSRADTSYAPAPTIPNYVLHGVFSGSFDWTDKAMTANPSKSSEYMLLGVELHANDVFKIHLDGDNWYGYSKIKGSSSIPANSMAQGPTDDNIKVLTTGVYDIYCDKYSSDGNIYIAIQDDGGDDPAPTPGTVKVTGITLNHSGKMLVHRDETFQLTATVSPSNATNKDVTWKSSDTEIAEVTTAGRIKAKSKTGTTTITAKTVDGNITAECLIYVNADGRPDYYLTGTINGRLVSSGINNAGTYTYPALPLNGNNYLIPDVELVSGDKLTVTAKSGATLKNSTNQTYEYRVTKAMSVNIYLNAYGLSCNYNYLNLVEK